MVFCKQNKLEQAFSPMRYIVPDLPEEEKKILILRGAPMYKSKCVWEFLKQALLSNKVT